MIDESDLMMIYKEGDWIYLMHMKQNIALETTILLLPYIT